ncbi:hypothetical protein HPP92_001763 [Vanilla planifolia]|uniref:EF-hand domain-containing protein n=1 Tax=Vanilla planifolia TaxID=51239 RepID=A0A835S8C6_VANPL|nr:hypothetical protein HPP92_001763 [Vanilla planifolia]
MSSNFYSTQDYAPSAPPLPSISTSTVVGGALQSFPGGAGSYPTAPLVAAGSYAPPSHDLAAHSFHVSGFFPPGTHPEIVRSFQTVDRDQNGFIDEYELQIALSSGYEKFRMRTIGLLMFLFGNPKNPSNIGPVEFAALWNCIGLWRAIFERFDRDRSGAIDSSELSNALLSLGYAIPPSVIQVIMSKYSDANGGRGSLDFDSFVECGVLVKGLTEKFKEKDACYTGHATISYDDFMLMVIPFLVP